MSEKSKKSRILIDLFLVIGVLFLLIRECRASKIQDVSNTPLACRISGGFEFTLKNDEGYVNGQDLLSIKEDKLRFVDYDDWNVTGYGSPYLSYGSKESYFEGEYKLIYHCGGTRFVIWDPEELEELESHFVNRKVYESWD